MPKKISKDQVANSLGGDYFTANRTPVASDPLEPTPMKMAIDKIDFFDKNPRRSQNPEYDSILESLRANGQEEALTITRRPGAENFMIKRGGNTRLQIMKMLFEEANDHRFQIIECLFIPWISESDCIIGHLNENTTQGRMTLIDKARGYRDFKLHYERENNVELGQRKLAALLTDKGASVSQPLLVSMNYALDVLEPAIPNTLALGLGKAQVDKLKKLYQTFERLAKEHSIYEPQNLEAQVAAEFHHFLALHDDDDWEMELVLHEFVDLIDRLIERIPRATLQYDIDACIKSNPWNVELISTFESDPVIEDDIDQELDDKKEEPAKSVSASNTTRSSSSTNQTKDKQPSGNEGSSTDSEPPAIKRDPNTESTMPIVDNIHPPALAFTAGEFDLKTMRSRIYTLALQFAKSSGVHSSVLPWPYGYGYFVELPKARNNLMTDKQDELGSECKTIINCFIDESDKIQKAYTWHLLFQAQGLVDVRANQPLKGYYQMPPECLMTRLLGQIYNPENKPENKKLSFSAVGYMGVRTGWLRNAIDLQGAFTAIQPRHMMKYVALLEARTQLMAYVEENSIDLWRDEK